MPLQWFYFVLLNVTDRCVVDFFFFFFFFFERYTPNSNASLLDRIIVIPSKKIMGNGDKPCHFFVWWSWPILALVIFWMWEIASVKYCPYILLLDHFEYTEWWYGYSLFLLLVEDNQGNKVQFLRVNNINMSGYCSICFNISIYYL